MQAKHLMITMLLPLMQFTNSQSGHVFQENLHRKQRWSIQQKAHLKMFSIGSHVIKMLKSYRMGPVHIPNGSVQSWLE